MDASTIRLILIVVGGLLILLLYLWERYREKREQEGDEYDDEDVTGSAGDAPYGVRAGKRDPELGFYDDDEDSQQSDWSYLTPRSARDRDSDAFDEGADRIDQDEPLRASVADSKTYAEPEPEPEPDPEPERPVAADSEPEPRESADSIEPLLVQLSVSARRYPFKGRDVLEVSERCGLYPGDMDIFHCLDEFDDQTRIYFSMANMVKPGTFPLDAMDTFSTPGLMLFAQLEGHPEDMTILDEMIATARKLALALNGDVLDDRRRPLTVGKEEEMRQAVLANEVRWAKVALR
ncbi:cell division protein ZipA [Imhoffiella purpurea]|uniref:Cell division protein ZipA n=1 Tax=Imhoffiella purpurea TaxID=1249627 RepID=W9VB08_9GAMM|nr:cell division protein ZipA [Imhoffiella purpurea]EXJ13232.1 Cell division protein ZipA [Imhoffiella purpurea]